MWQKAAERLHESHFESVKFTGVMGSLGGREVQSFSSNVA